MANQTGNARMTPEARFTFLRVRYGVIGERREACRARLAAKYRPHLGSVRAAALYDHDLTKAERGTRDAIEAADRKACNDMFALLDEVSPRAWRSGVPQRWVMESLTWADAITSGRLSVTPPCAYGQTPGDMVRFAAPVVRA